MEKYQYLTNCTEAKGEDIEKMVDNAKEITYRTFLKYIGIRQILNLFTYPVKNDYAVSFWKGKYNGAKCYFIEHSRIEYIFIQKATQ